jgi:hypothetical protein
VQPHTATASPIGLDGIAPLAKMVEVAEHAADADVQCTGEVGYRDPGAVAEDAGEEIQSFDAVHGAAIE